MEKSLRILMLIHRQNDQSPYCYYVHEQAKALRNRGHEIIVISCVCIPPFARIARPSIVKMDANTPSEAVIDGIKVYYPRCRSFGNHGERILGGKLMAEAIIPIAKKLHSGKPFDIVHAHMLPRDGHAGSIISHMLGIPFVLTVHGTDVFHYFIPGHRPWARNVRIAKQADALLAVSSLLLSRIMPYRSEGITRIVPNGVDLSLIPADGKRQIHSLLSVGTLKERKCMSQTIEAFHRISNDWPDATLTIVGEGPLESLLRQKINELGIASRVTLTGSMPHEEVLQKMRTSDVFVLPSWGEGFGIVYIEAMAAGMIAVGAEGEGIDGTIIDGVNGFLVPAGDTDSIESVLRKIFNKEEQFDPLREAGHRTAVELTWDKNAETMEEIYTEIRCRYE